MVPNLWGVSPLCENELLQKGSIPTVISGSYLLGVSRYIHLNPIGIAACRRLGEAERTKLPGGSARTVGLHYGGIRSSAVGNIRRKLREGRLGIRSDLDHLLSRFRTAHIENIANQRKV